MKKWLWVRFIVMLAFVATTLPYPSFAGIQPPSDISVSEHEKINTPSHVNCAGHDGQEHSQPVHTENDKKSSKQCCDGMVCKCVGGLCNSLAKVFGSSGFDWVWPHTAKFSFFLDQHIVASDVHSRIKRPPRV